jgi:hypothetical protein
MNVMREMSKRLFSLQLYFPRRVEMCVSVHGYRIFYDTKNDDYMYQQYRRIYLGYPGRNDVFDRQGCARYLQSSSRRSARRANRRCERT